jgi:hypothetical protein
MKTDRTRHSMWVVFGSREMDPVTEGPLAEAVISTWQRAYGPFDVVQMLAVALAVWFAGKGLRKLRIFA